MRETSKPSPFLAAAPAPQIPRRRVLQAGAALGAGLLGRGSLARGDAPAVVTPPGRARNLIFLVSDGMSIGTLSLADTLHRAQHGEPCRWCRLWNEPGSRRALVRTGAADSLVTDSAAGGSAWGIGRKVNNGAINMPPGGGSPTPILAAARAAGFKTGLVSTTRITDATPASFAANVPKRTMEGEVARQYLERGIDVLLGGGARFFDPKWLATPTDVSSIPGGTPLVVVRNATELAASVGSSGRLLGLFAADSMPYEIDRPASLPTNADMARVAIERLARLAEESGVGFALQIEGGRVDHAAHGNDAAALVRDQLAFDEAVGVAVDFARARGDTLVIVTTDHANANPGLTLYRTSASEGMKRLAAAQHSFEWIEQRLKKTETVPAEPDPLAEGVDKVVEAPDEPIDSSEKGTPARSLAGLVARATGLKLAPDDLSWLERSYVDRQRCDGFAPADKPEAVLGAILANHYGVAFMSTNHTADMVECVAVGPGAERLAPLIENTDLHGVMLEALDVGA